MYMGTKLRSLAIEEYAVAQAEVLLERLAWQIDHTTKCHDPESIHDLRVKVRHLANCLCVFRQFFRKRARKKVRRWLRGIKERAGEVRDRDIALKVLGVEDGDLSTRLVNERERARRKLVKALRGWARRDLVRKWRGKLELCTRAKKREGPWKAGQSSVQNAAQVLPSLAVEVFAQGRALASETAPDAFHEFRIHVKQFRDTLELFRPCYDLHLQRLLKSVRESQQILGEMNDLAATRKMLADRGLDKSRQSLFDSLDARIAKKAGQFSVWGETFAHEAAEPRWVNYLAGVD